MKKNKKIILITGVAGMIGSELTNKFIKDKNNIIIGIDNFILGTKNNIKQFTKNDNFKFFKINLEKKIKNNRLNNFLVNKTINEIWHLAANSDIRSGVSNADVDFKNTFLTTYNTLELIKKNINHNSKFIFTSSSAVFGDIKININETTPALYSCSNYGSMKLASEAIISSYSYLNNIKSIVFRLPNVVGKNLTHGVIFDLSNKIKDKKKIICRFLEMVINASLTHMQQKL
ncbi:NAD-dependent epimerase/dehydratase family protein [Candidatus Pelagibacter bacterium nBUS_25]|uniref:NAD-dependent epimerase/dehydratase family protein n=1 Tax=Candidatus Pelagibacter bacterium nBUS_25 TaxID=3374187 RepID=UPI003EBAEDF0